MSKTAPPLIFECTDNVDDVTDREYVDAGAGLIEDGQRWLHRQDGGELHSMTFASAEGSINSPIQVPISV
jgi:hypothetical protein